MKQHVFQLGAIAKKRTRKIIGLMSGTSLDGLDVALCSFSGSGQRTRVKVLQFETLPYDEDFKNEIRRVFAQKKIDFQHLVLLNALIAERHAELVNLCLTKWNIKPEAVDLLASHGQTVFHAPRVYHGLPNYPNATLQIGDGDHLAVRTGIITLSDFRQKHVAAGGEGAPLALYGDYFLFSKKGEERYLLNIGGIANFTYLPANQDPTQAFATDTGPGNTLLDAFARELFGVPFDEGARLAANGRVDERLLEILKSEPFFAKALPKTIGPELFSLKWVKAAIAQLPKGNPNPFDVMTTLTKLTTDTIAEAIILSRQPIHQSPITNKPINQSLYLSGGGAHNPLIISYLKEKLPQFKISPMKKLGLDGDAKEAVLFAVLANETVAGRVGERAVLGGIPMVGMGKVSFPG
ncbi:MAG: anhydro-N-acetylmuramic acid kinase [Saprospiraceae bacterium]|nr:anhydro-N-acetylmuramic acid kinase [Saprospiraceae bacterium]